MRTPYGSHNLRIISAHPWQRKTYRVQWPFLQRQFFGTVDWLIERASVTQTAPIILKDSLSVYRIQSNMQKFKKRKPEKQKLCLCATTSKNSSNMCITVSVIWNNGRWWCLLQTESVMISLNYPLSATVQCIHGPWYCTAEPCSLLQKANNGRVYTMQLWPPVGQPCCKSWV